MHSHTCGGWGAHRYATRFIEMVVMLCADHGPAVSGAAAVPPQNCST